MYRCNSIAHYHQPVKCKVGQAGAPNFKVLNERDFMVRGGKFEDPREETCGLGGCAKVDKYSTRDAIWQFTNIWYSVMVAITVYNSPLYPSAGYESHQKLNDQSTAHKIVGSVEAILVFCITWICIQWTVWCVSVQVQHAEASAHCWLRGWHRSDGQPANHWLYLHMLPQMQSGITGSGGDLLQHHNSR